MNIGIIGAGNIGGTLARHFVRLGHDVSIANSRGPSSLMAIAAETGARAVTIAEAALAPDLIVLAIPQKSVADLPANLFAQTPRDTPVVDTGNYYPELRDERVAEIDAGLSESEWVARQIKRSVVKAFNNIGADSLRNGGKPAGTPKRIALSVAGDQPAAKQLVLQLVEALGFDALDAGPLAESWRQQPGTPAYCHDLDAGSLKAALTEARRDRIAQYRQEGDARARVIMSGRQ